MIDARTCPHCGAAPCLPLVRKLTLFAGMRARCSTCHRFVQADARQAWFALLPAALFIVAELALRPHNYALVMVFVPLCMMWFFVSSVFRVRLLPVGPD